MVNKMELPDPLFSDLSNRVHFRSRGGMMNHLNDGRSMRDDESRPNGGPEATTSTGIDKLKANFALGLGANFFTMGGVVIAWIVLTKTEWVSGFWWQLVHALALSPAFMGDALNSYALCRIRLETHRGWDDIQITVEGRKALDRLHYVWRGLSLATTATLATVLLTGLSPDPIPWFRLRWVFAGLFALQFLRCQYTISAYFAPRVPFLGGISLIRRSVVFAGVAGAWFIWLHLHGPVPFSIPLMLTHGTIFFLFAAALHPMPSKFSIFRPGRPESRILTKAEPITSFEEGSTLASPAALEEVQLWQGKFGFQSLGKIRLPLPEMPIFSAFGEALLSPDRTVLALYLQSEIRKQPHRVLFSSWSGKTILSSDFGAADARFPAEVLFQSLLPGVPATDLLAAHSRAITGPATPLPLEICDWLTEFSQRMVGFLREEARTLRRDHPSDLSAGTLALTLFPTPDPASRADSAGTGGPSAST